MCRVQTGDKKRKDGIPYQEALLPIALYFVSVSVVSYLTPKVLHTLIIILKIHNTISGYRNIIWKKKD